MLLKLVHRIIKTKRIDIYVKNSFSEKIFFKKNHYTI